MAPLTEVRVTPRQAETAVVIDVCDACHGVWLDENELEGLCPSVSDLPARRDEVAFLGERGAGISTCPRCQSTPLQFAVVDVLIDFCDACGGVWLDGPEADELMLPPEEKAPPRRGRPRQGGYRASALQAVRKGVIDCLVCHATVSIEQCYVREEGLVCTRCHIIAFEAGENRPAPKAAWLVLFVRALELLKGLFRRGRVEASS